MWQKTKKKEPDAPSSGGNTPIKKEMGNKPEISDTLDNIDEVIAAEKRAKAERQRREEEIRKEAERERQRQKEKRNDSCRCF